MPFNALTSFVKLLNSPIFFKASVQYGTVVWPGNIDIAPETLWAQSPCRPNQSALLTSRSRAIRS